MAKKRVKKEAPPLEEHEKSFLQRGCTFEVMEGNKTFYEEMMDKFNNNDNV